MTLRGPSAEARARHHHRRRHATLRHHPLALQVLHKQLVHDPPELQQDGRTHFVRGTATGRPPERYRVCLAHSRVGASLLSYTAVYTRDLSPPRHATGWHEPTPTRRRHVCALRASPSVQRRVSRVPTKQGARGMLVVYLGASTRLDARGSARSKVDVLGFWWISLFLRRSDTR